MEIKTQSNNKQANTDVRFQINGPTIYQLKLQRFPYKPRMRVHE